MIKQSDDMVEHTTKPMEKTIEYIKCPHCDKRIKSQGIGGHLKLAHGIKGVTIQTLNDETQSQKDETQSQSQAVRTNPHTKAEKVAEKEVWSIWNLLPPWWDWSRDEDKENKK